MEQKTEEGGAVGGSATAPLPSAEAIIHAYRNMIARKERLIKDNGGQPLSDSKVMASILEESLPLGCSSKDFNSLVRSQKANKELSALKHAYESTGFDFAADVDPSKMIGAYQMMLDKKLHYIAENGGSPLTKKVFDEILKEGRALAGCSQKDFNTAADKLEKEHKEFAKMKQNYYAKEVSLLDQLEALKHLLATQGKALALCPVSMPSFIVHTQT